ncbi:NAD(P)H-dependent oxidoreductase [Loktanella sp. TSTF-M6]|uniref:NAD(P)H-dependent oxidoreductase n=1 Tax=Loktanella gaetbuli TaxID=2881335 RepID=A0ABS8BVU1_9RHOB|nr:NAD(P)H-dependent oxidoreductase [Loktanella gaetbuli]MCB5199848.1 NAD(P)H-dependent oxidoreductase [Loktanella gaetbuli]
MAKLLGISGSLRKASHNRLLIAEAGRLFGADTLTFGDIDLPLYNGDLEEASGIPAAVQTLSDQIAAADAVVISTPEYNKAPSGALKNALDWISRTDGAVFKNKPVAIMSATAGRSGGERAQFSLRLMLTAFDARVLNGPEVLVGASYEQFDENGRLIADSYQDFLKAQMDALRALI